MNSKKPEKLKVRFRQPTQNSSLDDLQKSLSKIISPIEKVLKFRAFFAREDVKKVVSFVSAMLAPVLIMSVFLPFFLKFLGITMLSLSVPEPIIRFILYVSTVPLTIYMVNFLINVYAWPKEKILPFKNLNFKQWAKVIVIYTGYLILTGLLILIAARLNLIPQDVLQQAQEVGFTKQQNALGLIQIFIMIVIVPAVIEEFIFRGLGFLNLRRLVGFWPAAICSSLLFATYHGQINVGIDTFVLGMFMALAVEKTGSLYSSMAMHFVKNSIAFYILFLK
jgi:membrane protease YdiL (CAAX protease family)